MSHFRLSHPPRALRQPGVKLDNIALVPASLLPQKAAYQALANRLPPGELLVVLPPQETKQRQALKAVARALAGARVGTSPWSWRGRSERTRYDDADRREEHID